MTKEDQIKRLVSEINELESELQYAEEEVCSIENALTEANQQLVDLLKEQNGTD